MNKFREKVKSISFGLKIAPFSLFKNDFRCKIILYWIFLIKTSFNKTGGWFVPWDNYVDITVGIYMRKVAHRNSEATIQKFSLK